MINYDSLLDSDSVMPSEVHKYGVVISVPTLYVNADEMNGVDRIVSNLRVISYEKLIELMPYAIDINAMPKSVVSDKCNYLINYLVDRLKTDDANTFMEFIKFSSRVSKDMDIDEDYYDVTTSGLSFDIIRQYVNDPHTGILKAAEPTTQFGYQLYSQIPDGPQYEQMVFEIRNQTNDTDFNRIQLHLSHFERTLTFTPGYVYSTTLKLKCLALFYVALYSESRPVTDYCSNDLKGNLLSYILDCVIRSRIIQAWQRDNATNRLANDMAKNYDSRIPYIKMCQLRTARERAQHFIDQLRNNKDLKKCLPHLNYDLYVECLNKSKLLIDGQTYYLLNSEFISHVAVNLPDLQSIKSVYNETVKPETEL